MQIDEKTRQRLEASLLPLHPHEIQFILFCRDLGFGTIEKLAIQNGLPVCATSIQERIDFTKGEAFHRIRISIVDGEAQQPSSRRGK
ncbi:MAG: hypothetical protein KatS3mg023_3889 [Armatimonadota bacterium]|nr:MAG: hypothetical protein KatS3mg023_3889 [Armatimonadota bacterium]